MPLGRWVPFAVLTLGCTVTAFAVVALSVTEEARARAAFESAALETRNNMQSGLDGVVEVGHVATALLTVSPGSTSSSSGPSSESSSCASSIPHSTASVFRSGFSVRNLATFLRQAHLDGMPALKVWPAGARREYQAVLFLEPNDARNAAAIGFDMATNEMQGAAMERARDSGAPAITEQLVAPFSKPGRGPAIVYVPVYRVGAVFERREPA